MMTDLLSALFLLTGAIFMLLAALGALRMPDLLMRLHATTKAGALGSGLIMVGVAVFFGEVGVTARALAVVLFIMLTVPVAAHAIARAGYFTGMPLWPKIVRDELRGRYDEATHVLEAPPQYRERGQYDHPDEEAR